MLIVAAEWHIVSDYIEQPNTDTQPKVDWLKKEIIQHYKTIKCNHVLEERFMVE